MAKKIGSDKAMPDNGWPETFLGDAQYKYEARFNTNTSKLELILLEYSSYRSL